MSQLADGRNTGCGADLEAARADGTGADIFVGYGGVVERPAVARGADWFVHDHGELRAALAKHSVAFIGSGTTRHGLQTMSTLSSTLY